MGSVTTEKAILTVGMLLWWLLMPMTGYTAGDCSLWPHVAYMWSHASVWHLAGNLFVLWIMRSPLRLLPSAMIAIAVSYLPAWSIWGDVGMTLGFSGVLFAMWGIKWGVYCTRRYGRRFSACAFDEFAMKAVPFAMLGIVVPHLNWCIHLYALITGYVYGRCRGV